METLSVEHATNQLFKEKIQESTLHFKQLKNEVKKIVIGNEEVIETMLIALLCDGHILLEGVPGVAKTTIIKTLAATLNLDFKRIQFTPDLLPSDLLGSLVYNQKTGDFETKKGPIFTNLVLADEINRAPAKVQSALLESMQEQQVTLGSETFKLAKPFLVFATQNPIEQEGTYPLPEAQVDRFMFKINVGYPTPAQEKELLVSWFQKKELFPALTAEAIFEAQALVKQVYVDELIIDYIIRLVDATRNPAKYGLSELKKYITLGASPRATLALNVACRAHAFLKGRHYVTPDDIKTMYPGIIRHRIALSYMADTVGSDEIIKKILATVPTP